MEYVKNNIGKILFFISIILCIYMIFSNLTNVIFEIDEYFTFALVKFPINDMITITSNDVHPPLYYLILKSVLKVLNTLNIQYNLLYILKILSITPYVLIIILSATKIRKEYHWLTAGLFCFTLITLSEFFINYLSIRMYSWAILFLLLSFVYLKGVLEKSDNKSWALFTLFTILGAYTHYFVALSSFLIYLFLLIHIIHNDNNDLKKWILSTVIAAITYVPWIPSLLTQLKSVHESYWIPQINFDYFINCISSVALNNSDFTINNTINLPILAVTLFTLILLIVLAVREYKNDNNSENSYILIGIFLFIITLFLGIILSVTFKPIIRVRYLVPSIAVFWFAVSILVGKLDNKKLLTLALALVMILSVFCFAETVNSSFELSENAHNEQNILNDMKHDNNSIILTTNTGFFQFGTYLNDSKVFTDVNGFYGIKDSKINKLFDYKLVSKDKFKKLVNKNPDKTIYIIEPDWSKIDIGSNITSDEIHHVPNSGFSFYSIKPNPI